jgi:hypothetical protein
LSSNNDKRKRKDARNIILPSTLHINSCTMADNENIPPPLTIEEIHNLDLSDINPTPPNKIYDELVRVLGEAHQNPARNALPGPSNVRPQTTVESDKSSEGDARSKQMSPTEDIHPGYPYRENLGENDDLPERTYPRPYLAVQVDQVSGDPRIRGKEEKGSIPYDKGMLTAQPMTVVYDDIEDEVASYPLGEDAYLDMDFLRAISNIDDRGLAAETLRLVQLQNEFQYLEKWQKRLETREQAIHLERGDLIQKKRAAHTRQTEVYKHLRAAKAASCIILRLIRRPDGPSMSFPSPTRPYYFPPQPERRKGTPCYWCGSNSFLYGHKSKDCALPHQRCDQLKPGRCVVPDHHEGYYSFLKHPKACPYNGNHEDVILSSEHA